MQIVFAVVTENADSTPITTGEKTVPRLTWGGNSAKMNYPDGVSYSARALDTGTV